MFDRLLDACPYVTIVCWLTLLADALLPGFNLSPDVARLPIAGAVVGTLTLAAVKMASPAADMYLVGKAMGRKEIMAEIEDPDVVRLADRPLRMVAGGGRRGLG